MNVMCRESKGEKKPSNRFDGFFNDEHFPVAGGAHFKRRRHSRIGAESPAL